MQAPSPGAAPLQIQSAVGRGQGRVFTLDPQEAHASNTVVTCTLSIDKLQARVLFDSGATLVRAPGSDTDYWAQFGLISHVSHFCKQVGLSPVISNKLGLVDLSQP